MKNPSQYHIQKRKDGRYAVTVMFKGKRQSIYGKTKKETLEKLTKVINDIQYAKIHNLQNFSAATTTLSAWATECVETYSKEYVRGNTYYAYKNIINRHLPYWGTSDFIRLLSFSEKLPVLPFCAYGFPLPVERYKKHLKTIPLFGGLSDTDAAAFSFVHENKHAVIFTSTKGGYSSLKV